MRARSAGRPTSVDRFCLSALLAFALLAAALLSVAPGLHERLHPGSAPDTHFCVVTLFASGHCEAAGSAPVFTAPTPFPLRADLPRPALPALPAAHFFSLLEHAPPALA
ncbi:MAG: hypothetical protein ABI897_10525 [Spartobacteria bacterium]